MKKTKLAINEVRSRAICDPILKSGYIMGIKDMPLIMSYMLLVYHLDFTRINQIPYIILDVKYPHIKIYHYIKYHNISSLYDIKEISVKILMICSSE